MQQTHYTDILIICVVTVIMDVHPNTGDSCKINTCAECTNRTFCTYESCAAWIHHLSQYRIDNHKIGLPVPEDDLPLPLPFLPALPLVCQGGLGDLYWKAITRFKPGAMPGGRKVTGSLRLNS